MIFFQNSFFREIDSKIQARLSTECGQKTFGLLFCDDFFKKIYGQRLDIDAVGDMRIRHDRCGIAVDENDFEAFLLQGAASLGACVVKFCRLPYDDWTRADDHDLFQIIFFRHGYFSSLRSVRNCSNK